MSGYEYMWNQIRELELVFLKMGERSKRLRKIKGHLQGYLDEMVWRIENRNVEDKRNFLINVLKVENWQKYIKRLKKIQVKRQKN